MSNENRWLLYGAYGFTGERIARLAVEEGHRPVLAGRREEPLRALADELSLSWKCLDVDDLEGELADFCALLHCAGPFERTALPAVQACLKHGCHYVDITGEISVFRDLHGLDREAKEANIGVLPGAGFDVVPTDSLAARLAERVTEPRSLELAFMASSKPSGGTAASSIRGLAQGGFVRIDGALQRERVASRTRTVDFGEPGLRLVASIPWGDVYTATISTGIPNVVVYMAAPPSAVKKMRRLGRARWLLKIPPLLDMLEKQAARSPGPNEEEYVRGRTYIWGEVKGRNAQAASALMVTPNGYRLTVRTALDSVVRICDSSARGFLTPSCFHGPEYVTNLPDVSLAFQ